MNFKSPLCPNCHRALNSIVTDADLECPDADYWMREATLTELFEVWGL